MKAFRSTSSGQFGQSGSFQPGTYTFNALVLSSTNSFRMRFSSVYGEVFVAADVTPNEWTKVEMTFTLNSTYTRFDLSYQSNPVTIAAPMLEHGNNASTAVPHPDDIDEELDDLGGNIISMGTEINQTKSQIQLLAEKTVEIEGDISEMGGAISEMEGSLSVQAGQIAGKVSQSDFNALGQRVGTAESNISLQSTEIAGKVSQTDFNALGQRVGEAESELNMQAGQIGLKVSQTEYDGNKTAVSQQMAAIDLKADGIGLKIDNFKIGGRNLIAKKYLLDWNLVTAGITMESSDANGDYLAINQGLLYSDITGDTAEDDIFQYKIKYKANTQYAFKIRWRLAANGGEPGLMLRIKYTDGTYSPSVYVKDSTIKEDFLISEAGKTIAGIVCLYGENLYKSLIYDIQLTEGNAQVSGYMVAPEDDKERLLATGIDIDLKKITVTAPQFIVRQPNGNSVAVFNENILLDNYGNFRMKSIRTPFVLISPTMTGDVYNINFDETPHFILNGGVSAGYVDLPNAEKWNGAQITVALDNYIVSGNDSVFISEIRATGDRIYTQEGVKTSRLFLPNFRRVYYFFRGLWTGSQTIWIVEDVMSMYGKLKIKGGEVIGGGILSSSTISDQWCAFGQFYHNSNGGNDKDIGIQNVMRYTDKGTAAFIPDSELRAMYQVQFFRLGNSRVRIGSGPGSTYNVLKYGELNTTASNFSINDFVLVATKDIDLTNIY